MSAYIDIYKEAPPLTNTSFGDLSGVINGANLDFTLPGESIASENDFVIFRNGQLIDRSDYLFTPPNYIHFVGDGTPPHFTPKIPDRLNYLRYR